jgi:signal transduction histidine kinase
MNLETFLSDNKAFDSQLLTSDERSSLVRLVDEEYLPRVVSKIIFESEEILAIDPGKSRKQILEDAAEKIVKDLGAEAASIRLFDSRSFNMISFGGFGMEDDELLDAVSAKNSIAGLVVKENRSIAVPNILEDDRFMSKNLALSSGYHSLLAVPLTMPSFVGANQDLLGSLQIYYRGNNKRFGKLEIIRAEMLARRVSYVLAKKKILDLHNLNKQKEQIVDKIFIKLSNREAIKTNDFFNMIIPELDRFLQLQSCSLFTLSDDQKHLQLAATYPTDQTYHECGHTFTVTHHSFFGVAIHGNKEHIDTPYERVNPFYVLIKNPLQSEMVSEGMRSFVLEHQIHSILLVPLHVEQKVRHILVFYATEHKLSFTDEEIELLIFFGKEITKASRLEFLGNMLHDFKNPAIAMAGLAARAGKLLAGKDLESSREKLSTYLKVITKEATRLQDMSLTISAEGHDQIVDLGRIAVERYRLNEEVIKVSRKRHVTLSQPTIEEDMMVRCPVFGLERILDNLLNNATKAIPPTGGLLELRCFREGDMVCLEVKNSGTIPPDVMERLQNGEIDGRGLNIIWRFVRGNNGKISYRTEGKYIIFKICFPFAG